MTIAGNGLTMYYTCNPNKQRDQIFTILPNTNFKVKLKRINFSPLLEKQYLSEGFDFSDLDISQHINVKFFSM